MLKLVGTDNANHEIELTLVDKNDRPTKLLMGLAAAELALDCLIAYAVYNLLKGRKG